MTEVTWRRGITNEFAESDGVIWLSPLRLVSQASLLVFELVFRTGTPLGDGSR